MRILLMSRIIGKTGVGNHIKQLSEELVRQGHEVWCVSSTNDLNIGEMGGVHFEQVELRSKNPIIIANNIKQINKIISQNQVEIVHCHHRMAALVMHWYNLIYKIPVVYTLHLAPIPCDPLHRFLTHYGDRAIAISKEVGMFLHESLHVPADKISYVLNGVDETALQPVTVEEKKNIRRYYNIPEENVVISLHSRIAGVKNHLDVVKAVDMLSNQEKSKLTVICSGETTGAYYDLVLKEINDRNLSDKFVFTGWCDARTILGSADALLLPSKSEGFALNCIEAMFMEVPVTRSKTAGYEDMKEYLVGLESITPEIISRHIRDIISGEEYDESLVRRAKQFAEEKCTIEAMTRNTVAVYNKILLEKQENSK